MPTKITVSYRSDLARHRYIVWSSNTKVITQIPQINEKLVFSLDENTVNATNHPLCLGRFYPVKTLRRRPTNRAHIYRVTEQNNNKFNADFNPPIAYLNPGSIIETKASDVPASDRQTDVWQWAGMDAPHPKILTQFTHRNAFVRRDEKPDGQFYARPRNKPHLDATCRYRIRELYHGLIFEDAKILDLMCGWQSHLPRQFKKITGLGMNLEELKTNPQVGDLILQNLNHEPYLPYENDSFDTVINTASIEYLIHPQRVLQEVMRVLVPGGIFVCTFSNRFFPSKAIYLWTLLHPAERLGWVLQNLSSVGFCELEALMERGLQRDSKDRYSGEIQGMDPLFAAWGFKPSKNKT